MEQPSESPKPFQSADSGTENIARLREAIANLEIRVSALERGAARVTPPTPTPHEDRERIESRLGLTAINRIGAITLAIGIIFFFKYAVDNQWIGAVGRVVLGLIAGIVLIGAGEWLHTRDQRVFAQGVAGCGLATIYIALYAAFAYYQLIPHTVAFLALLAACALAVILSLRYGSSGMAVFGLLCGFLAPVLLHGQTSGPWLDFACLLLLDVVSVIIAVRQNWPPLIPVNAIWTVLAAAFLFGGPHPGLFVVFTCVMAAVHLIATRACPENRTLANLLYAVAHACFAIAVLREIAIWVTHNIGPANQASVISELGSVFLALYAVAMITLAVLRRSALDRVVGLILIALVVAKLYLYDVWLLTRFYRISAFVALGILLLAASFVYSRLKLRAGMKPE